MPSLPPVSAKVIADAEQFVQEFRRAERAARGSAAGIDREVSDLTKKISRQFSLSNFGKDILRGSGLFGGFQIANTISEEIVGHYREAAELAKATEESTGRQLDYTRQLIALKQSPAQQLATLRKQYDELFRTLEDKKRDKTEKVDLGLTTAADGTPLHLYIDKVIAKTREEKEEINHLTEETEKLAVAIATREKAEKSAAEKAAGDVATSDRKGQLANRQQAVMDEAKLAARLAETYRKVDEAMVKQQADADAMADKYRELADPTLHFTKQIEELNSVMGQLTVEQYNAARAAIELAEAQDKDRRVNTALTDFFGDLDAQSQQNQAALKDMKREAQDLGYAFQSAFEDAVIGGSKLGDVLRGLAQDIEKIWLRKNITDPFVKSLGGGTGFLGGIGSLLGFATGGDFTVGGGGGTDSQVVAFRATPGEQVSVRTPGQQGAAAGGAQVFNFSYNFQTGVTRQEVAGLLPRMVEAAKQAVADGVQRGGGYRRSLA